MTSAAAFEPHRRTLTGLAYRMLGSVADAEDIVQDAFLRWHRADRTEIADPRAYLIRTVTRLCLDALKSARVRRETYIGPWLPEPVLDADPLRPDTATELADDISVALLLALERLSPLERAAFLLRDIFARDYAEIATALDRAEPACRQLAARARAHIRASRPRFRADPEHAQRLAAAFLLAAQTNDVAALAAMLAENAVLHSDGGGQATAARNLITGRDPIARFIAGILRKATPTTTVTPSLLNGLPGIILRDGRQVRTAALFIDANEIHAIYIVANPAKLRHLAACRRGR